MKLWHCMPLGGIPQRPTHCFRAPSSGPCFSRLRRFFFHPLSGTCRGFLLPFFFFFCLLCSLTSLAARHLATEVVRGTRTTLTASKSARRPASAVSPTLLFVVLLLLLSALHSLILDDAPTPMANDLQPAREAGAAEADGTVG